MSQQVKSYLPKIREYFATQPIIRAWLFGSCSRGEETPHSDIDLLVCYDKESHVSLLTVCHIINELEDLLGRPVDLVEDGFLLPFAVPSAHRDKILIYERES
ncbi:MAG: nucleotidyltransferase domain-containing protein [Bacteroidales bacterium]|nr:nucleotidyltransferase domain-containing protein [Bacteroidales bacterium]